MTFDVDWPRVFAVLISPGLTLIIWVIFDRIIRFVNLHTQIATGYFVRNITDETRKNEVLQRVKTFRSLFFQSLRFVIGILFFLAFLNSLGVDPRPLLAGVGVAGLAISLAAQNILRDILNGLLMVAEDQFNVGDVVELTNYSGTVESFSLRTTRLRAFDGRLITIPNSAIIQVVNYTKTWAAALVDVPAPYNSDLAPFLKVLKESCDELKKDYGAVIIEEPTVMSIVDFRPNDMLLRILVKTLAGQQWATGRALRTIIKRRLDEAGLTIPVSQVVLHRATPRRQTPRDDESQS